MKKEKDKTRAPTEERTPLIKKGWDDRYDRAILSIRDWIVTIGMAFVLVGLVSWLFYKSIFGMLLLIPFLPIYVKRRKRQMVDKRKSALRDQFRECLQSVNGALSAGMSMENAWKDAEKDMLRFLGPEADMTKELLRMNRSVEFNIPMEKLLLDFAERSGLEDVQSFGQVFQFAKRGGGDLNRIIQNTYLRIAEKTELEREIETTMAAKKMEQRIMSAMPLFILLYIGFTSSEFLNALYGNLLGAAVMTACLMLYLLSIKLGERIVRIEV